MASSALDNFNGLFLGRRKYLMSKEIKKFMKIRILEKENEIKFSKSITILTLITIMVPTIGFDIYAHTSSWSSPESYKTLTNLVVFGIEFPRYLLLGPFLSITTLFGYLPGMLPFFLIVYLIIKKTIIALKEIRKVELGILTILFISYNLIFLSASSISIIFFYLWFIFDKKDSKLFFFGTFSSPIGLMLGTIIFIFFFFSIPNIKNFTIYFSLYFLTTLLVAKLYPLSEYDPTRNITMDSFYYAREFTIPKQTEFLMLIISSSFIFIILKVKTFSVKSINFLLPKFFATLISLLFLFSNFEVLLSYQNSQTFITFFSKHFIGYFNDNSYESKKIKEVHNRVFCTAYLSNRLCEKIFFSEKTDTVTANRSNFIN